MRWLFPLAALTLAVPATAQTPAPARFNPAADYVTVGQDEPGYRRWLAAASWRPVYVKQFDDWLAAQGVGGVVPTWQLLRTASMWSRCNAEPFEVPPAAEWPHMVETLQYVRKHVIPVIGPVEPVSVYRNPVLNTCAGGAADSAHRGLYAIDMVPLRPTDRMSLMKGLCAIHAWQGGGSAVGLGFYKGLRFHIDSKKYRKWGAAMGDEVTVGCPHVMARIAAEAAAAKASIAARKAAEAPPVDTVRTTDPLAPTSPVEAAPPPVEAPPASDQP